VVLGLAPIPEEDAEVKQRDFVRKAIGGAVGAALIPAVDPLNPEPWDRLARALSVTGPVDAATVEHLERATTALESLEYELSPSALIGPVRGHLDEVSRLLGAPMPASRRRQLLSIAGEAAATAGWLMWDLDRPDAVAAYWRLGAQAAEQARDRGLAAFVGISASFQYRERPRERLEMLRAQERNATPRTRAWLLATAAGSAALLGDERACMTALDRADALLAKLGDDRATRRPRYDPFEATRMLGERGAALVKLAAHESGRFRGRERDARAVLEQAIAQMDGQPRMVNSMRASYARAPAQRGKVDGAVQSAHEALDGAEAMGISLRTLSDVARDLEPWATSPAVQRLSERVRAA